MDWKGWEGKRVFLRTNKSKVYSGVVKEVADVGDGVIFFSIIDKFGSWVTVVVSEIIEIKEEDKKGESE